MNPVISGLFNFQFCPIVFNQVINIVQIKLNKANPHSELFRMHFLFNHTENMDDGSMKIASAIHIILVGFTAKYCVSLSCPCLPIS